MARKNLLKGFKKPKGITFEHSLVEANSGRFVAYPFERGYGTTIGNSLRRILLSSIQGYAVTAVRFTTFNAEGLPHLLSSEYESIPGVVEDLPEIIARIKKLQIKMPEDAEGTVLLIECKGAGVITGASLEKNEVEIMNKDHLLFTMMDDANIEMEMQIDLGRGYVPSELNEKYIEEIGYDPHRMHLSPRSPGSSTRSNLPVWVRETTMTSSFSTSTHDEFNRTRECTCRSCKDCEGSLLYLYQLR